MEYNVITREYFSCECRSTSSFWKAAGQGSAWRCSAQRSYSWSCSSWIDRRYRHAPASASYTVTWLLDDDVTTLRARFTAHQMHFRLLPGLSRRFKLSTFLSSVNEWRPSRQTLVNVGSYHAVQGATGSESQCQYTRPEDWSLCCSQNNAVELWMHSNHIDMLLCFQFRPVPFPWLRPYKLSVEVRRDRITQYTGCPWPGKTDVYVEILDS